jgi:DnaJ-class molecular chaperone
MVNPIVTAASASVAALASSLAPSEAIRVENNPACFDLLQRIPRGGTSADGTGDGVPFTKQQRGKKKKTAESTAAGGASSTDSFAQPPTARRSQDHKKNKILDEILLEEDYYRVLGTSRSDVAAKRKSDVDKFLSKLYRKRAVQTHPDKTNGDRRAFDKVAKAFEVLSNPTKREVYDKMGLAGLQQHELYGAGATGTEGVNSPEDLFRMFFGGGTSSSFANSGSQANKTVRYQMEVSLEDLYNGVSRTVVVAPSSDNEFMFDVFGRRIRRSTDGTNHKPKPITVDIPAGCRSGQTIVVSGAMDFDVNAVPGDAVFVIQPRRHETFQRVGHDLAMTITISLSEAIAGGVTRQIRHLNGQSITLGSARKATSTASNQSTISPVMIRDGDVQVLKGRGMPKDSNRSSFGDLYIQFRVEDVLSQSRTAGGRRSDPSTNLTDEEREELARLLQKLEGRKETFSASTNPDGIEYLETSTIHMLGKASKDNSDDDVDSATAVGMDHEEMHQGGVPPGFASMFGNSNGGAHQQFFFSSASDLGSNPFFGNTGSSPFGADRQSDESVQCSQM